MDPFAGLDFMDGACSSCPEPEVFGRSVSDDVGEPQPGPVVEPDPVIMGLPPEPESDGEDGEAEYLTMWMRIEAEEKRRASS